MKNQDFRNWLEWRIHCTILAGIFGSYHYLSTGVYPGIGYVTGEIMPHALKRYGSVRMLDALAGELLFDSDNLQF